MFTRFDALCGQVAPALGVHDAILDGEVIAADASGRPQFYDLLRRPPAPAYAESAALNPLAGERQEPPGRAFRQDGTRYSLAPRCP